MDKAPNTDDYHPSVLINRGKGELFLADVPKGQEWLHELMM